jgi:hypothetical protein
MVVQMLADGILVVPYTGLKSEKYDPEKLVKRLKKGDGVFLGKLDQDLEIGRIVAIGIVQDEKALKILWKAYKREVYPNPPGGITAWKERCFLFNGGPADRYNLGGDFLQCFPNI